MNLNINFKYSFSILLTGLLAMACHVYSPPIRIANNSAPGKLESGNLEIGAAVSKILENVTPGIHVGGGYAINDKVAIEAGTDTIINNSVIGYAGARITPKPISEQKRRVKLLFDIVLGGGLGVGGRHEYPDTDLDDDGESFVDDGWSGDNDGIHWSDRLAGGAYLSSGIGFNVAWFDLFARFGFQVSKAYNIPTTLIYSCLVAPQFNLFDIFLLYFGPGAFGYKNELDSNRWFYLEGGIGFVFDLSGQSSKTDPGT
ncbi:MAG: hypothetical protein GY854_31285 [Deltaproteobacteria bacterium]|nr:hypothetical protein [Deltaproteobacteria bacterium]